MKVVRLLFASRIVVIPAGLCALIGYKGSKNLSNQEQNPRLVYVELFHRHGDRTPTERIYKDDIERENKLWISMLPKQYYPIKIMKDYVNKCNLYKNINQRLNGTFIKAINNNRLNDKDKMTNDQRFDLDKSQKTSVWMGQLTEKGVLQLQDLGRYLRSRYVNEFCYLSPIYKASYDQSCKLFVKSTNYKRTIFSADSLLNGLYDDKQRFNGDRIPIHIDQENEYFLYTNPKCKKYYRNFFASFSKLTKTIPDEIKRIDERLTRFYGIGGVKLVNALNIRLKTNTDLPLMNIINRNEMEKFVNYFVDIAYNVFAKENMLRMSNGVLLGKLLNSFENDRDKFVINSGHDFTLAGLLWCLLRHCQDKDILDKHHSWPDYADSLIFEVWEYDNNDNYIRKVRIIHNQDIMKINGKEFIELRQLETMWRDLLINYQTLINVECCC